MHTAQDGIQLTYENFLDFSTFAVRVAEADLPSMLDILKVLLLHPLPSRGSNCRVTTSSLVSTKETVQCSTIPVPPARRRGITPS